MQSESALRIIITSIFLLFTSVVLLHGPSAEAKQSVSSDSTGYLYLISQDQSTYFAIVNDDFSNISIIEGKDSLLLAPGIYDIRLVKKMHKDIVFRTRIESKEEKKYSFNFRRLKIDDTEDKKHLSSYPRLELSAKNAIRTDYDTEIFLNDEFLGIGFSVTPAIDAKTARLKLRGRSGEEIEKEIELNLPTPFKLHEHFVRPRKSSSIIYSFIPGASQMYKRKRLKGWTIIGSQSVFAISAVYFHTMMNSKYSDLKLERLSYTRATDPVRILEIAHEMDILNKQINTTFKLRNSLIGASIALYIYNIWDGIFNTDDGYRKNISFDPYVDIPERQAAIQMSVNF